MRLPIPLALGRFKQLPQRSAEVWQGDLVRLPAWVEDGSDPSAPPYRLTAALWVSLRTGRIDIKLASQRSPASPELAIEALFEFAAKEARESKALGGRPSSLEVRDPTLREALANVLSGTNTAVVEVEDVPAVRSVVRQLEADHYEGRPVPGLLEVSGMGVDRVRAFADGAALFYEARPWQHLANEDLIVVDTSNTPKGMAHVSLLGNGGQQFGLAFFASRRAFERALGLTDPRRMDRAFGVTFGPPDELPFADVDLWEDHALRAAGPLAYPLAADIRRDGVRRPSSRMLTHMEAVLRALADLTEDELDAGQWERRVETFDGPLTLTLSLPLLLEADPGVANDRSEDRRRPLTPDRARLAAERANAQIGRFLEQGEFATLDEVNEALEVARQQGLFERTPEIGAGLPVTALEQAQEIAYDAAEAEGRLRIKLARKALSVSADCADACVVLGDGAATPDAAREWYERGVEAGQRALGASFEALAGEFWSHLETRPYMRARLALAGTLRSLGREEEGLWHYRELLRLNPGDNQGIRYLLVSALLAHGYDDEGGALLDEYDGDIQATWPYARALWLFRTQGDGDRARSALLEATRANPHVALYLLNQDMMPWTAAPHFALGSPEEAAFVAGELGPAFQRTAGALEWLRKQASRPRVGRKKYRSDTAR